MVTGEVFHIGRFYGTPVKTAYNNFRKYNFYDREVMG